MEEPIQRMEGPEPDTYLNRMLRAAKLDVSLYKEVQEDRSAVPQAMGVVILSSLAAGVGGAGTADVGLEIILLGTALALAGWFVWAFLTFFIGTRILPEPQTKADYGELLRTIGFSSTPGIIRILGVIPGASLFLLFLASIWMLVGMIIAVRVALNYTSTMRAVGVCAIGWLVQLFVLALLMSLFGGSFVPGAGGPAG